VSNWVGSLKTPLEVTATPRSVIGAATSYAFIHVRVRGSFEVVSWKGGGVMLPSVGLSSSAK